MNLLSNARTCTPRDGTITVRTQDLPAGRVRVEVIDTGQGIPPPRLPQIFEAIETGDAGAGSRLGGGLGLAIAKALVEAHRGSLTASSPGRGCGATFALELEARPEAAPDGAAEPPARGGAEAGLRILLVEDHPPTLDALRRLIAALGHRVATASNLAAAKEIAARDAFDLAISDVGLPDGTGRDLMQWLKSRGGPPGIALSGYGMIQDADASLESGFAMHLVKPVDSDQLKAAIRSVART
jgi:CheY-like chemotaxis protein